MDAGSRRSRVRFDRPEKVPDGYGGDTVTWVCHWQGYGQIERARSFRANVERVMAGGVGNFAVVRIHVPYDALTAQLVRAGDMRAVDLDTGVTMNVNAAQDTDNRRRTIVVTATENLPS